MADKAMEEVMGEFEEKFGALNAGKIRHDAVYSYIPIACRSYARKVVEEIWKKRFNERWHPKWIAMPSETIPAEISRLTDKEPT